MYFSTKPNIDRFIKNARLDSSCTDDVCKDYDRVDHSCKLSSSLIVRFTVPGRFMTYTQYKWQFIEAGIPVQSQKAESAYFTSKQISPFGFSEQLTFVISTFEFNRWASCNNFLQSLNI